MEIQWTRVTWYSQALAIILALLIFGVGFYLGGIQISEGTILVEEDSMNNKEIVGREQYTVSDGIMLGESSDDGYFDLHLKQQSFYEVIFNEPDEEREGFAKGSKIIKLSPFAIEQVDEALDFRFVSQELFDKAIQMTQSEKNPNQGYLITRTGGGIGNELIRSVFLLDKTTEKASNIYTYEFWGGNLKEGISKFPFTIFYAKGEENKPEHFVTFDCNEITYINDEKFEMEGCTIIETVEDQEDTKRVETSEYSGRVSLLFSNEGFEIAEL